jgi:hypothetical protein
VLCFDLRKKNNNLNKTTNPPTHRLTDGQIHTPSLSLSRTHTHTHIHTLAPAWITRNELALSLVLLIYMEKRLIGCEDAQRVSLGVEHPLIQRE